ncbi:MAG: hypothetical protein HQQ73_05400 [Desulfobulbaceae bacterium]|nr:hypothetical protein [Desulfobulbaceae bacterium]
MPHIYFSMTASKGFSRADAPELLELMKDAERQISLRYGHISPPWFESCAIDQGWKILEPWLGYFDS